MKPITFTADIYETDQIMQTVICYLGCEDDDVCDVEIKMPLYIKPSAIRSDVQEWLREVSDKRLGDLKFELAPQNSYIAP